MTTNKPNHLATSPVRADAHLRVARPVSDLAAAERFWVDGLGLTVLHRGEARGQGEHDLLMLGWPDAPWHLELVGGVGLTVAPSPTEQDLLVLYLAGPSRPNWSSGWSGRAAAGSRAGRTGTVGG